MGMPIQSKQDALGTEYFYLWTLKDKGAALILRSQISFVMIKFNRLLEMFHKLKWVILVINSDDIIIISSSGALHNILHLLIIPFVVP